MNIFDFDVIDTGGNCKALFYKHPKGYEIVATSETLRIPEIDEDTLCVGLYKSFSDGSDPIDLWYINGYAGIIHILPFVEEQIIQLQKAIITPDMEDYLSLFWRKFCSANNLPFESADELLAEMHMNSDLTWNEEQKAITEAFITLWELSI